MIQARFAPSPLTRTTRRSLRRRLARRASCGLRRPSCALGMVVTASRSRLPTARFSSMCNQLRDVHTRFAHTYSMRDYPSRMMSRMEASFSIANKSTQAFFKQRIAHFEMHRTASVSETRGSLCMRLEICCRLTTTRRLPGRRTGRRNRRCRHALIITKIQMAQAVVLALMTRIGASRKVARLLPGFGVRRVRSAAQMDLT
mmetsp:Transcript_7653/g.19769  ORF Transcript_7653/g.19769 Transcript_7653/m.19769 type:complete len:201 (+) Transcript_7653:351-953(+)